MHPRDQLRLEIAKQTSDYLSSGGEIYYAQVWESSDDGMIKTTERTKHNQRLAAKRTGRARSIAHKAKNK